MEYPNWREEYKGMKLHGKKRLDLLENGPHCLTDSWLLQSMFNDWKRKKGIKEPDTENKGQLKSSFKDWNNRVDLYT